MKPIKKSPQSHHQEPAGETPPRLPHERDGSSEGQTDMVRGVIQQAFNDIESGQQDTDLHNQPGVEKPENFTTPTSPSTETKKKK